MSQIICHICGSADWNRTEDYFDGHTLMEREEWCLGCGYRSTFYTGNYTETIGRWEWSHSYTETDEAFERRRSAREVATLIRRLELGLIHTSIKPFVEQLRANPAECSTAAVLADWIEDHPDEFGPDSGYAGGTFLHLLRSYDDASGFVCRDCGGAGEIYQHASNCTNDLCGLAGGMNDCWGEVVPCGCKS